MSEALVWTSKKPSQDQQAPDRKEFKHSRLCSCERCDHVPMDASKAERQRRYLNGL